jgi:hypothetical protein
MDMAVLMPWLTIVVMFWARNGDARIFWLQNLLLHNPLLVFSLFWLTMLFYMIVTDLLNAWKVNGGVHALAMIGVLAITSLLWVRLLLYFELAIHDFFWLRETLFAGFNLMGGIRGEILLILVNYLLWLRVARYTDRSITFFSVGVAFRLGMLLVVLGSALLAYWSKENLAAIVYMVLFFAFGLSVVALARIDQKAVGAANSSGALLPWSRFAQIWVVIFAVLGAALAAGRIYTPQTLRTVLGLFAPVGRLLETIFRGIVFVIFLALTPILEWLMARMQALVGESPPAQDPENLPLPQPMTMFEAINEFAMLRYCIAAGIIFVALALFLIFFVRMVRRERASEDEEAATEGSLRPGPISLGLDRLKDWFALLGRYGLGSQLLAAISVENIYANLTRLARKEGFPRQPSQAPDHYLPTLMQAFPGHESELTAITAAYLRVRYGEHPVTPHELDELKAAYASVTTPPNKEGSQRATT